MISPNFSPELAEALPGPEWLVSRRVAAAEQAAVGALPTPKEEVWRYTPISKLDLARYQLSTEPGGVSPVPVPQMPMAKANPETVQDDLADDLVDGSDLAESILVDTSNGRLCAVNGDDRAGGAVNGLGSKGLQVRTLNADDAELAASVDVDLFALMNTAFSVEPVLVKVPAGVDVPATIVVRHWFDVDGAAVFPRLIIDAGPDSSVRVLELYGSSDIAAFVSPVVEIRAAAAARVGYLAVQDLGPKVWHIGSQVCHIASQAHLRASTAALGGEYARMRLDTHLLGRGATGDLISLYYGDGEQTLDFRTFQDHVAPDTSSSLLFKGAVDDSSRSVYTGMIRVRPDARGTNAYQTNRNIKLSETAWAESVPNLEIENNEVRCSHASAVGPIDHDQLFYLESRGVPTETAEQLIVRGFFDEVLEQFSVPEAVPAVRERLQAKIAGLSAVLISAGLSSGYE